MKIMPIMTNQNSVQRQQYKNAPSFNGKVNITGTVQNIHSFSIAKQEACSAIAALIRVAKDPVQRNALRNDLMEIQCYFPYNFVREGKEKIYDVPDKLDPYLPEQLKNLKREFPDTIISGVLEGKPFSL